jgi:HK97 gp10 family phage protein
VARPKVFRSERLIKKLLALRDETAQAVKPAMIKAAEIIIEQQKAYAPEITGELKDSITYHFDASATGARKFANETRLYITAGDADAPYAPLIEIGTQRRPATPFFFPGYRVAKKKALGVITRAVTVAVKGAAR